MKTLKQAYEKFLTLKWYYQLLSVVIALLSFALFVRFLIWVVPLIGGFLALLFVFTEGEIFSITWQRYKQSRQAPTNPFFMTVYHWLTEEGVAELPVVTLQFLQGVEFPDIQQGLYFVHINKIISEQEFLDFELKMRQAVKYLSNGHVDAIVSKANREPFLAIKIRLVPADEVATKKRQVEEDF